MTSGLLGRLARACYGHPKLVLSLAVLLTLASAASLLTLKTEQNLARLLPPDLPSIQAFNAIRDNFDLESNLFILMEGGSPTELVDASDEYVKRLRKSELVREANNQLSDKQRKFYFEVLGRHLFLTLPEEDLAATLAFLQNPAELHEHFEDNLRLLRTPAPGVKERIERDPLDLARRANIAARLMEAGGKTSFSEEGYLLSEDGTVVLVVVKGEKPSNDLAFGRQLVAKAKELAPEGFEVSLAGGYAVSVQDEGMIRGDMTQSAVMSMVLIFLLFWIVFRSFRAMLQVGTPLLMAILWTIGVFSLLFGRLNPLIGGSAAIIAGLGIDFSIHVMTRFRHELSSGMEQEEAVTTSVTRVGTGIVIAAATTIAVFVSFMVSDLRGMAEFGLVTGIGIFLCLLATLTVLPALMALGKPRTVGLLPVLRPPVGSAVLGVSLLVILAAAGIGFLWGQAGFSFEPDWKNLRPKHDPAVETQERLGRLFWGSDESVTVLVEGDALDKLARLDPVLTRLRKEGTLAAYQNITTILPPVDRQTKNRETLRGVDAEQILRDILKAMDDVGFNVEAYEKYLDWLGKNLRQDRIVDESLLQEEEVSEILDPFLSADRKLGLALLFPADSLWEAESRKRVVEKLRGELDASGVEYKMTGFKIVSSELESLLRVDFSRLLLVAGGIVLLIAFATFRDPRVVFLAMLPLIGGVALLAAFMKLAGHHVNVMNLIAFPMVMGLGIDDGVHLAHLYRDAKPKDLDRLIPVTLRAIVLTTVTTILGFGSLALTENRGVASMGLVTGVGMICCLLPSFFTLPAAIHLLNRNRIDRSS